MADDNREDRKTQALVDKHRRIASVTQSQEWPLLKKELIARAVELAWVLEVDLTKPDALVDMRARQIAFREILKWLFELEGAELTEELLASVMAEAKDDYITNLAG